MTTPRLDRFPADDLIGRPVCAFDKHIRLDGLDDGGGSLLVEYDDGVNAGERRQNLGPLLLRDQRPVGPFARANGTVGIHSDDERVAVGTGGLQIADVAGVKDIEDAVREDDLLSRPPQIGGQPSGARLARGRSLECGAAVEPPRVARPVDADVARARLHAERV